MSDIIRCCLRCGRWGTRQYRPADSSDNLAGEGYICSNDRACWQRVARAPHVHLAPTICDC
jgi:hypothetical protein